MVKGTLGSRAWTMRPRFFEADSNLSNPEALVATNLFVLVLCSVNLLQPSLFFHTNKGPNFGDTKALRHMNWHDAGIWLQIGFPKCGPKEVPTR